MLMADETFNVRMGLFAPQWSRAGIGYTIILCVCFDGHTSIADSQACPCACSTPRPGMESSRGSARISSLDDAHWRIRLIQARYVALFVIFFIGVFNLCKTLIASQGCLEDVGLRNEAYRNGRHPLRPQTEALWMHYCMIYGSLCRYNHISVRHELLSD